jgi:hypothetical protein
VTDARSRSIFVCYRRDDAAAAAGRLRDRLEQAFGADAVFMDVHEIPPGVDFRIYSRAVLSSCSVVLVVIGRRWLSATDVRGQPRLTNEADFVRVEIATALSGSATVVPVLVDGGSMPPADELPEDIRELAFRNAVSIRNDPGFRPDSDELLRYLAGLLARSSQPEEHATASAVSSDGADRNAPDQPEVCIGAWVLKGVIESSENWATHAVIHRTTGRRATLSVLKPRGMIGRHAGNILTAAELVAGVDHPALAPVLDWGEAQGRVFVVIGTVAPTLTECVSVKGPLDEIRALRITSMLSEALTHLHDHGIVHQLVTPDSVLIDSSFERPVIGWPMFCIRAGTPAIDAQGKSRVAIVVRFAAPEAFSGVGNVDPSVDIYGLGEVLYFMLAGSSPFSGANVAQIILAKTEALADIRRVAPAVSRPTALLVEALLHPSPAHRPASANEVKSACERLLRRLGG